jgi:hypothetical protein
MITDPTDIAGCRAWYDASDAATITLSGGQVTKWNDKSGNAFDVTGSPTGVSVASAAQNGLDVIRFTPGSSNYLRKNTSICAGNTTARTFAFVVRYEDATKGCTLNLGDSAGGNYGQLVWLVNDATTEVAVNVGGTSVGDRTESDTALDLGSYYVVIVTISYDAGTGQKAVTYNVNGVDDTPDSVNIGTGKVLIDSDLWLGWYANDADLYLAEVAVYNTVLSPTEIGDLFDYFNDKWAVVAGASDAISFVDFDDGQIIQRAPGDSSKTISIAGGYSGSPTAIECRIVEAGTDTPISGHDWQVLDSAPAGGGFSGDVDVPQGGWYNVDLRFAGGSDPLFAGTNRWGVGLNVLLIGQSNMYYLYESSASPPTANDGISLFTAGAWAAPTANGAIALANALNDALGIPIGLIGYAVNGSPISDWDPGGDWTAALAGLNATGGDCEFVLWHQGETDAITGTSKASYKASLANVYAQCLAATGRSAAEVPFLVGLLSTILTPPYSTETDATWQAIKDAHVEFCDETAGAYRAANYVDVDRGGDIIHMSAAGYATAGERFAQSILYLLGDAAFSGAGARIGSATITGTTVQVRLAHDGGGDFTPTSGITGFEVLDDGTPVTISSATRQDGNTIALDLAAVPAGTVTLRYQYGEDPDISGAVKDDTVLALPLLYVNGLAVSSRSSAQNGARRMAVDMAMGL